MEISANTTVIAAETATPISNVITFPRNPQKNNQNDLPNNMEDAQEKIEETRYYYAETVAEEMFEAFLHVGGNYNFFLKPDRINHKDMVCMQEILKSVLLRQYGIHHPMQDVIDANVELESIVISPIEPEEG